MDPKQNSNQPLDPKLQEAYDRVMGVNVTGDPTTGSGQVASTTPTPATPTDPTTPVTPTDPTMPQVPAEPVLPPMPTLDPLPTVSIPPSPVMPEPTSPVDPAMPVLPTTPEPVMPPVPTPEVPLTPTPEPSTPVAEATPTDTMSATMSMPHVIPHESQTVKIGSGGNPVSATVKTKGKGISPVILIFGALAFLAVYAVFWVKFFGYSLPFLPQ